MRQLLGSFLPLLLVLGACERVPQKVSTRDIEDALVRERPKVICRGLEMPDEGVRKYAAEKLQEVKDPIAAECTCAAVVKGPEGWDKAVASGLRGASRDDLVGCFAEKAKDVNLARRVEAVALLATMTAPSARAVLLEIAADPNSEADVRVLAVDAVGGAPASKDKMLAILAGDSVVKVRAAAANGLGAVVEPDVTAALQKAASEDAEGLVRGNALVSLKRHAVPEADTLLCTAMMEDSSPEVRQRAVAAFKGTKRPEAIACLRNRAMAEESSAEVRGKILEVLKSSPSDEAAKVLCDAIPFWAKTYLKEAMPDKVPSTDIITAQNDRDWERSYACVESALRKGAGGSCFARKYVAGWFKHLGGNASVPKCPGYDE